MSDNSTIRQIRAIAFMRELNTALQDKVIELLAIAGVPTVVNEGVALFNLGEATTDEGIVLLSGELTIQKAGEPELVAYAPDLVGEMGQFNPQKTRTATVKAKTQLKVIRFDWRDFHKAADARLSTEERDEVTKALQDHAWRHFTG